MTDKRIAQQHHATFEEVRQFDEDGNEFWSARDIAPLLEYQDWRNFMQVVDKARLACEQSGRPVADHFGDVTKMVGIGSGAQRPVPDVHLSRYACYLIVQNGDPAKPVIANGQTYFAMQTRRQELADDAKFARLSEDEKRLAIRNELATHNKHLAAAAKDAGVETSLDYAIFQDHGYKGLYGGLGNKEIHAKKGLKKSQKILDHMGSTELAANCSAPRRPKKSCAAIRCAVNRRPTRRTLTWAARCARRLMSWVAPCPRTCPNPNRASSRLSRRRKS